MVHKTVYLGTGRRKSSIARVRIMPGTGQRTVNGRNLEQYLNREVLYIVANQPFVVTETAARFDLVAMVRGGGSTGQAGALSLGIARALKTYDPGLKPALDKVGLLTRDPR